jgi:hypothetical protein
MKRTTVRLDDDLLAQAKKMAADTGRTLTAIIEDSLREALMRRKMPSRRASVKITTFRGKGLHPGVDLDDSAGLLALMESRDAPR